MKMSQSKKVEDLSSEVLDILEKMIDIRLEYLMEKKNENHYYASSIYKNRYLPEKQKLHELLKKELDTD